MITTKTCSTCEHYPNDKHCIGCKWDESKGENSKWELKENPIVIERKVLEQIRAEIEHEMNRDIGGSATDFVCGRKCGMGEVLQIIDKYK